MDSLPGGGAEIFSERVRRIICDHKIDGGEWLEVARAAHRMGHQVQLHHALRPHRERGGPRRSPVRLRSLAGRDRRLRHLHPAGLSPRQYAAPAHPEDHRFPGFEEHRGGPSAARQHSAHQGVLGNDDAAHRAESPSASAPTTSTARWWKRRSTTTPAPRRRKGLRRGELLRLIREAGREPFERDTLYRKVERTESTLTVLV